MDIDRKDLIIADYKQRMWIATIGAILIFIVHVYVQFRYQMALDEAELLLLDCVRRGCLEGL